MSVYIERERITDKVHLFTTQNTAFYYIDKKGYCYRDRARDYNAELSDIPTPHRFDLYVSVSLSHIRSMFVLSIFDLKRKRNINFK